ncbi:MAG: PPOX class F420-dependent oxidoreductase, partial [Vicinamibacterales bacterium]
MTSAAVMLEPFVRQRTVRLTTFRRDGTPVGTPVSIAVDGDRAYIRTYNRAGKAKRLRNNPNVEIAPSTIRGKPTGPSIRAELRLVSGDETKKAARLLAR